MHETGIVRDLVRRLEQAAHEAGAERVSGVEVWLGALSQFSPEHFREHFEDEARGTVAEGAALRIETSDDADASAGAARDDPEHRSRGRRRRRVTRHDARQAFPAAAGRRRRLRLDVTGAVQGVGFRPFVYRLAVSEGLGGFVRNTGAGASLEIEGPAPALDALSCAGSSAS